MSSLSPTPPSSTPDSLAQAGPSVSRRTLIASGAWAVPAIVTATAIPAAAAASDAWSITINFNGPDSLEAGASAPVQASVFTDGKPAVGTLVTFSSSANVTISPTSVLTDSSGIATATLTSTDPWERPGTSTSENAQAAYKGHSVTASMGIQIAGSNAYGLGDNTKGHLGTGSTAAYGASVEQLSRSFRGTLETVVSGADFSIAWSADRNVISVIGANDRGQLGLGDRTDRSTWVDLGGSANDDPENRPWWGTSDDTAPVQIAAGRQSAYVLLANGYLYAWGANEAGQLGTGTTDDQLTPQLVTSGMVAVAAGDDFVMVLDREGVVWAVGSDDHGQIGDQTVRKLRGIVQIAAGDKTGYALTEDGYVFVWGSSDKGQWGNGTGGDEDGWNWATWTHQAGVAGVVRIAAGHQSVYALLGDGTVWAWGRNNVGQLGDGTTDNRNRPIAIPGLQNVVDIAANGDSARALLSNGEIRSWGGNGAGIVGDGTTTTRTSPVTTPGTDGVARLGASSTTGTSSYLLVEDRRVEIIRYDPTYLTAGEDAWFYARVASAHGDPWPAQDIHFNTPGLTLNALYTKGNEAYALVAADRWTIPGTVVPVQAKSGYSSDSRLINVRGANAYAVGVNNSGQFGSGQAGNWSSKPDQLPRIFPKPIVQVAAGAAFTLVLLSDGTVWSAGSNSAGQLADGTGQLTTRTTWAQIPGLNDIVQIAAGRDWALALTSADQGGFVFAWGRNDYGQIGSDKVSYDSVFDTPMLIHGLNGVDQIAAGRFTGYALADGKVASWGGNDRGQLGRLVLDDYTWQPHVLDDTLTDISAITAAASSAHVLLRNGQVWGWGDNAVGQLGLGWYGSYSFSRRPLRAEALTEEAAQIACAEFTVFVRTTSGEVRSMGTNTYGQLGTGEPDTSLAASGSPRTVNGLTDIVDISAGVVSGYALTSSGTVMSWGGNGDGQLGDGTQTDSATPVEMASIRGVVTQISPASHSSWTVYPRRVAPSQITTQSLSGFHAPAGPQASDGQQPPQPTAADAPVLHAAEPAPSDNAPGSSSPSGTSANG